MFVVYDETFRQQQEGKPGAGSAVKAGVRLIGN
jgi:hypothetical protein